MCSQIKLSEIFKRLHYQHYSIKLLRSTKGLGLRFKLNRPVETLVEIGYSMIEFLQSVRNMPAIR